MENNYFNTIFIAKGIGIVLVVIGHWKRQGVRSRFDLSWQIF